MLVQYNFCPVHRVGRRWKITHSDGEIPSQHGNEDIARQVQLLSDRAVRGCLGGMGS